MNIRKLFLTAAAVGCSMGLASAESPKPASKTSTSKTTTDSALSNQQLADTVATKLAASGAAQSADVSIAVSEGVVTLTGTTKDSATREKIIQEVRTVSGVKKVRDGLTSASNILQAQAVMPPAGGPMMAPMMSSVMPSGMGGLPAVEPMPLGAAGMAGADMQAPPLPPYAWPTYAPHNNLSRVAYPQAYPHNAFPFIGPFYPFPKVPLGWRKATLEWEDGHWWIGKTQSPHDYWRVRFW